MFRQPFPLAMTKKSNNQKPTDAEMNILGVIWKHKSTTVRKVFDDLSKRQNIGYTTVLKLMQIMTDKGLIERDVSVRPQVYRSARPPKKTQRMMLRELVDCAFGGSAGYCRRSPCKSPLRRNCKRFVNFSIKWRTKTYDASRFHSHFRTGFGHCALLVAGRDHRVGVRGLASWPASKVAASTLRHHLRFDDRVPGGLHHNLPLAHAIG